MRLICPNCDAQYELSDDAIPPGGRDVQCSNCGHAWYQNSPEAEAAVEAEEELFDAPVDEMRDDEPAPEASARNEPAQQEPVTETQAPDQAPIQAPNQDVDDEGDEKPRFEGPAPLQRRSIDESLLAVLREEAEREATQRQSDEPVIETQTDMGLEQAVTASAISPAARRVAGLKGRDLEDTDAEVEVEVIPPRANVTRREMLPDIEEINSTLRPNPAQRAEADNAVAALQSLNKQRGGFRSGFTLMVLIAVVMVAIYVMAPKIVEQFPASAAAMATYVELIDKARLFLDGVMQHAIGMLKGISGSEG